jgi:hypothetical protein
VEDLLAKLAGEPANGIDRVLAHDAVIESRGFPDAADLVLLKIGYEVGLALTPPLISDPTNLGMHGYWPDQPEMRSSFFLVGPTLAKGHSVGEIDRRSFHRCRCIDSDAAPAALTPGWSTRCPRGRADAARASFGRACAGQAQRRSDADPERRCAG